MGLEMAKHNIPYVNLPAQGRDQMEDLKKIFEQVVLKGSFVGTHDDLAALEKRLAEYCGTAEAVALNSYRNFLQGKGHLRVLSNPLEVAHG